MSGGPPGGPGKVGRPTQKSGRGQETNLRVGLLNPPSPPGGPPDSSPTFGWPPNLFRTFGWASRPLPDLCIGLPTPLSARSLSPDPFRTPGWAFRPLPEIWVGLPTPR